MNSEVTISEENLEILKTIPIDQMVHYLENVGVVHFLLSKEFSTEPSTKIFVEKRSYATDIEKVDGVEVPVGSRLIASAEITETDEPMRICFIKE